MTLLKSCTLESLRRSPFASFFTRKCNSPISSLTRPETSESEERCDILDGTANTLTFFGLALDCIILNSLSKALIRGTNVGKASVTDPSSTPGETVRAACIGGTKLVNLVPNVGTFIFTEFCSFFGVNSARLMKKVKIFVEVLSTPSISFPFGVLRNFLIAMVKISSPAFFFMSFLEKRSQPHDHIAWPGYLANTFLRISVTFFDVSSFS
mmetsp:Transcript_6407/g.10033  ORF Transcript_6407/g.10033 Transcript_6407/m.10033 type:complete len:210 (-) Transcript_6407:1393-2022(-)